MSQIGGILATRRVLANHKPAGTMRRRHKCVWASNAARRASASQSLKLRGRRKALERGREEGVGVGAAGG
jgi:hypothetical protein